MRPLAAELAGAGHVITLLSLKPTAQPLWARFDTAGFWHHFGGQFGRIQRSGPLVNWRTTAHYLAIEQKRLTAFRSVNYLISPKKNAQTAQVPPEFAHIAERHHMSITYLE